MKKILVLLIAIMTVLTLTGCNENVNEKVDEDDGFVKPIVVNEIVINEI